MESVTLNSIELTEDTERKTAGVSADRADWASEVGSGERFQFGANWLRFLERVDDQRIARAEESLKRNLGVESLAGKTFLDAGSGSGLFSLAARRLGAEVLSFDYDEQSVACTRELRNRFKPDDTGWDVRSGSVLDRDFLTSLGTFDIVYSWGVLHHTGAMWQALDNIRHSVAPDGLLYIAIYNDQGSASRFWTGVKKAYVRAPGPLKYALLIPSFVGLWGPLFLRDTLMGNPLRTWNGYKNAPRGMDPWRDLVDWVGGYPFEVAKPEQIFDFYADRGFRLQKLITCGGRLGCNEYVFKADES
jgi:2-polyprenyl-6-hydroxyphenyl methylase/3-demethylubiquinone-9 3-methyltransferase